MIRAAPAAAAAAALLVVTIQVGIVAGANVGVDGDGCDFPMVQQQFSLADTGLDGCHRLDSVARIFGEAAPSTSSSSSGSSVADASLAADRFAATRFAAANLVFLGRVVSGRNDEYAATASPTVVSAEVDCLLKGRLPAAAAVGNSRRPAVVHLVGFEQSMEGALCRSVRARTGDRAVFFATAVVEEDAAPGAAAVVVRVNENGVELDANRTLAALACRENRGLVRDDCRLRLPPPLAWMSARCRVSVAAAVQLLEQMRRQGSAGLRPECRGAPLHRPAFEYASNAGAPVAGTGGSQILLSLAHFCLTFATLLLPTVSSATG